MEDARPTAVVKHLVGNGNNQHASGERHGPGIGRLSRPTRPFASDAQAASAMRPTSIAVFTFVG